MSAFAADRRTFPSELKKLADPATEFPVFRLTDPAVADCRLSAGFNRFVGKRGSWVLYTRDGSLVCRVDVKTGVSTEIATAPKIEARSLTMTPDERVAFWTEDETRLVQCPLATARKRTVYECPSGWKLGRGMSVSEDGLFVSLVERKDAAFRIRLIGAAKGNATTVVESADSELRDPVIRPKRAGFIYTKAGGKELWLGSFDATQNKQLKTPPGDLLSSAHWSGDGRIVEYLWLVEGATLPQIRECQPDPNEDRLVAPTSKFAAMSRNSDATVFVGASSSKASPHVLLLLRSTKREFTLAEHKASEPSLVSPVFSSNSQRIFFQSDREGKWAIYYMQVEKLVEETETP